MEMMGTTTRVLLVEDDAVFARLVSLKLAECFEVCHVRSGAECLERLAEVDPAVVLMDVLMDGMDGFECCRRIKQSDTHGHVPVVFLSASDSLANRMAGYEAGGSDYLVKPAVLPELQRKLDSITAQSERINSLQAHARQSFDTAMQAMSTAAEVGLIMHALRDSLQVASHPELARLLLATLDRFGLDASVQLRAAERTYNLTVHGPCSPIEASILDKLAGHDRIVDLSNRTAVNYDMVTVMVKNMPLADPERYGRIKDNLAMLAEGIDTRARALDMELAAKEQNTRTLRLVESLGDSLVAIEQGMKAYRRDTIQIMEDLTGNVKAAFQRFGLTEAQVQHIRSFADDALESLQALEEQGGELDGKVEEALEVLYRILCQDATDLSGDTFF